MPRKPNELVACKARDFQKGQNDNPMADRPLSARRRGRPASTLRRSSPRCTRS